MKNRQISRISSLIGGVKSLQVKDHLPSLVLHVQNCSSKVENILSRRFSTTVRNMIWETDVTEFHTPDGKKVYLSAIMDRFDHSIVSFNMSFHNDQDLVSTDLRKALAENPGCTPILHSDRGSTYTTKAYNDILRSRDMLHSMSRVNRCIDNGPMEGFWGTLKCEAYYGKHIRTAEELMGAVRRYMYFYNHCLLERHHFNPFWW